MLKGRIEGWASVIVGALVVFVAGWLTLDQMQRTHVHRDVPDADAAEVPIAEGGTTPIDGGRSRDEPASSPSAGGASSGGPDAGLNVGLGFDGVGGLLVGDGGTMPSGAPRSVRIGVVLVQYAGAEGAPSSARAKPDALKAALQLAEQARADWKGAVLRGDSGSSEDIGRIPRGVLERVTEIAVFSLEKDAISEPLETPKGYWVVKRVE